MPFCEQAWDEEGKLWRMYKGETTIDGTLSN